MRVTILGCGGAGGVPTVSRGWGLCDPTDLRNLRRRSSILVQSQMATILVDTPPDLRNQLLDINLRCLDAVLYTHEHADHVHGLDDLREINRSMHVPLPVYGSIGALQHIVKRFDYAFELTKTSINKTTNYRPVLQAQSITGEFCIHDIVITPFKQSHGYITTLGFRFGRVAYSTDVVGLSEMILTNLINLDTWIVGCLTDTEHETHASLAKVIEWTQRIRPNRVILTHMGSSLDYTTLQSLLPTGIEPAFDNMIVEVR